MPRAALQARHRSALTRFAAARHSSRHRAAVPPNAMGAPDKAATPASLSRLAWPFSRASPTRASSLPHHAPRDARMRRLPLEQSSSRQLNPPPTGLVRSIPRTGSTTARHRRSPQPIAPAHCPPEHAPVGATMPPSPLARTPLRFTASGPSYPDSLSLELPHDVADPSRPPP